MVCKALPTVPEQRYRPRLRLKLVRSQERQMQLHPACRQRSKTA